MLFLLYVRDTSLKAWAYVKKYWYVVAGVLSVLAAIVVCALTGRKRTANIASVFNQIENDHNDEINKINAARTAADTARAVNEVARQKALLDANKQHVVDSLAVDAKQKAAADRMLREQGNDPNKVAEDLGKSLSICVVKHQGDS